MRRIQKIVFFIAFYCSWFSFKAQSNIDSLKIALKNAKHDTVKCNILHILAETASDEEWSAFNEQCLKLAEQKLALNGISKTESKFYQKQLGQAFCLRAYSAHIEDDISKALEYYYIGLKFYEESGDKPGIAFSLHQIAYLLQNKGDIPKALELNSRSLKIKEEIGDKAGIALSLNSIGIIYEGQGDYSKALEHFIKSLKLQEEIGDKEGEGQSLNNIGAIYNSQGDPDIKSSKEDSKKEGMLKALQYYDRSIKIFEETGDKIGMATSFNNIGVIYGRQGNITKALEYYTKSLTLRESIGDKQGVASSLFSFGVTYLNQKNYSEALKYALRSMKIGKELNYAVNIRNAADILHKIYKATGKYKLAYENYELYTQMRDSIDNEITRKATIKQQIKYHYEKQAAADSIAHIKESEIKNAQLAQQKAEISQKQNQQYALFGGLALVIVFAGFMFNRFKISQKQKAIIEQKEKETQKQNEIILQQKLEVEEKQKEILDSIHYAKKIQRALLPSEKNFANSLNRLKKQK